MGNRYDKEEVRRAIDKEGFYLSELPELKSNGTGIGKALCVFHSEKTPSLSIDLNTGSFNCFGCGKKGDIFKFRQERYGEDFQTALEYFANFAGMYSAKPESKPKKIVKTYDYRDETGTLLFQTVRHEPKDFRQRRPDGKDEWAWNLQGVRLVPYNLSEVLKAKSVVIVEGEKDADNLKPLGLTATTSPMGAGKWRKEYNEHFKDKRIAILSDNDDPGKKHAQTVAGNLHEIAESVKVVDLPGLPYKGDVSDWIKSGGTKEQLVELIKQAPEWVPVDPSLAVEDESTDNNKLRGEPVYVGLEAVTPEKVEWLWYPYIPQGKITLLDGDPGVTKSLLSTDLIARITSNQSMPNGSKCIRGGAVLMALEDGLADTIVPRLEAAGGDKSRVVAFQGVKDAQGNMRLPTIEDVYHIEEACRRVDARLVVIDPLMGYVSGEKNTHKDQDVRRALAPLVKMAEKLKVAVVVIRHLNKSGGSQSIYRGGGSIGIIGLARAGLLVAKDPENESRRILAGIKSNLGPLPPSLSYEIEDQAGTPRIVWGGVSTHTADALLAMPSTEEEKTAIDEAREFLLETLGTGSVDAKNILTQSRKNGINDKTLQRAKRAMGVKSEKADFAGGWRWRLPDEDGQEQPKMDTQKDVHLRGSLSTFDERSIPGSLPVIEVVEVVE